MPQLELTASEVEIIEFVLSDLAEAIEDGDRREFDATQVAELVKKVLALREGEQP